MRFRWAAAVLIAGGLFAAAPASAQFMTLSRCHAAFPCDRPFGLQYRPDSLIAGPWANAPSSAVSAHIELKRKPEVEVDARPPINDDVVDNSVRAFLRRHPALKRPEEKPVEKPATPGPPRP